MKRKIEDMETIVWQTPANPPERHDYIFRDRIRYVKPYYFEFISHVKNRWAGKTIVDLFSEEFKGRPRDYYVSAVKAGRIQVDGQRVPISYVVQSSQKISHFLHRHEPPVMAWDVEVLCKEPEVLTVCKPASLPVHPCGQYRKNTVLGILQAEHGLAPLFPIHRLDRLVSGLLILARSSSRADIFRQQIESGRVQKQYIARVLGVFPEDEQVVNANVNYNAREGRSTVEVGDNNINGNDPVKGKAACTKFTRICTNGQHSIVLCQPITGRTHQIRVHLQYTGHPIANDMLYLSECIPRSATGMSADRAAAKSGHSLKPTDIEGAAAESDSGPNEDFSIDPMCTNCPNLAPKGYDGDEEGLWLHCVKYSGPDWTYECPYPVWSSLS
ncbi:RNA pseudouridine synthase 7 [Ipomoea triloba]|uniref:RNA pseudouridine synthase 7 n=1 Tax=Ipomoea triloba TaxID=35885 RepID=UPI00125D3E3C|nr:RNA pseudouridine synthase 7 [Ipomoea triloba]GMD66392.1 RNA pseudouridine synthase 7 [Ipomoea batatas]GMD68591.1 RNA pseudouridine synthase 7 [Ipomoea batatas]